MAKIKQIFLFILLIHYFEANSQNLKLGSEQTHKYLPLIEDKKVGIVANQTSIIGGTHIIDSLLSLRINISKIFTPEHGFRGDVDAGQYVKNEIDIKTGISIISLYGKNKKPQNLDISKLDVMIFDIQDVGVRFYTYISTLHYVMEALAENNIPLIILDRPNPNSHYIDGPILNMNFQSFVGMHPVPIVYGMTIGEYANMINEEGWLKNKIRCDLIVIKMQNYSHQISYQLPIKPSPNLPNSRAVNLYPSLCLFEGTTISVGRGTDFPFQHFGAPYLKSNYSFIPQNNSGSKNPKYKNILCSGIDLRYQDNYMTELNLQWLINTYHESEQKENFFNSFFDKLAGTDNLRKQIIDGKGDQEIKESWQQELFEFKKLRKKYLLYK
ncbi:MAG: DUF1343 domain-containing protein [Bacteroidota bacterium]|nr:DUF1343 domain-containing protein [Bacteroidota bacterium]